ncbi:urea carboxylase-associated family protein [Exilibacterium tricleocarpae]|uniref:Urea carboxylase-associated family protein n=1 Tax=Exilibacterium tricleocarpae TaxID=2591008 RepID=A0A545TAJ6_9GAMM|nr:urea amidolyase associated protein UAAP1 [Exilibacterium tricleocarpae]TQV74242.1 urea carboxylase-associated family protein [Exilibacterium tricleocarpae]
MSKPYYSTTLPGASHWSLRLHRGVQLTLTDLNGGANVGMLFYNPEDLLERYNAPDTLKCQHTFKLTRGHCLYSDMGRIFCSITEDTLGWHETVCGTSTAAKVAQRWGGSTYQEARNQRRQNGYDSFLVELAKYGLTAKDMAANVNFFSKVAVDETGNLSLAAGHSQAGARVSLRFEMDTLVIMHNCPHPLSEAGDYPHTPIGCELAQAQPVGSDDECMNACAENRRGFENNRLYHFGLS